MSRRLINRTAVRRAACVAASVVAFGGTLVSTAAPAQAGSLSDCPATFLCVWEFNSWGGARGQFAGTNANWGAFSKSSGGTWNNVASSAYNHGTSGLYAWMWDGTSYTFGSAGGYGMPSGFSRAALSDVAFNNVASSNNWG